MLVINVTSHILILISFFDLIALATVFAFNIDEEYPIVISNKFNWKDSHFGASVVLLSSNSTRIEDGKSVPDITGWVIVGTPKANSTSPDYLGINEPGILWRCALGDILNNTGGREVCRVINMDPTGVYDPRDTNLPVLDRKDGGWLGGSMFVGDSDRFVACASRWINRRYTDRYFLNGMCYWVPKSHITATDTNSLWPWLGDKDSYMLSPLLNITNLMSRNIKEVNGSHGGKRYAHNWAYGQFGFSVHLTPKNEMIVGAVGVMDWMGTVVHYRDTIESRPLFRRYNVHPRSPAFTEVIVASAQNHSEYLEYNDYFGYSVTSGRFFSENITQNRTQFASGAPRAAQLSGKVLIFSFKELDKKSEGMLDLLTEPIEGSQTYKGNHYGSYFGSALLALDVNGDGFDDLLVGAPLYGTSLRYKRNVFAPVANVERPESGNASKENDTSEEETTTKMRSGDEGCVFVYLSTGDDFNRLPPALCGDKVAGARFGTAISSLRDINSDGYNDVAIGAPYENEGRGAVYIYHGDEDGLILAQKLQPEMIDPSIRSFGWSLSSGVDIDGNQYPDLAVGAYESNHVIIYRTIPIIHFTSTLLPSIPKLLSTTEEFNVTSCITYTGRSTPDVLDIRIKLTVEVKKDEKRLVAFVQTHTTNGRPSPLRLQRSSNSTLTVVPAFLKNSILSQPKVFRKEGTCPESIDRCSCHNFTAIRVGTLDGITGEVRIRQEFWVEGYDRAMESVKPIHYEIKRDPRTQQPTVNFESPKIDFKAFFQKTPMPANNMFVTETMNLPVGSICEADGNPACEANLTINAWLTDPENPQFKYNSSNPFMLGTADILTLEVELSNHREVANLPIDLHLKWSSPPTVRRFPENCGNGNGTDPFSSNRKMDYYKCSIRKAIKEMQKETVTIGLDMSNITGMPHDTTLHIYVKANTSSVPDHEPVFKMDVALKTQMRPQHFSHEASEIEYGGNSSVPTFGIRQGFEIGLDGPTSAAALQFDIHIPINIKVGNVMHEFISVKKPIVAYDGQIEECKAVNKMFSDDPKIFEGFPSPSQIKVDTTQTRGDDFLSDNNEGFYNDQNEESSTGDEVLEILRGKLRRVRRSIVNALTMSDSVHSKPILNLNSGEIIKRINCNSTQVECIHISCIAFHFTPAKKAVLELKLRMSNNVTRMLLQGDDDIGELWIESMGSVRTLDLNRVPFGPEGKLYFKSRLIIPPPYELPAWILIVSVAGGLLSFTVVTIILMKCGFFRRPNRDEMERQKQMEKHFGRVAQAASTHLTSRSRASTCSTARVRTSSSSRKASVSTKKASLHFGNQLDPSSAGSIMGMMGNSPGTIAKQRYIPGAVDLHELNRIYDSADQNDFY